MVIRNFTFAVTMVLFIIFSYGFLCPMLVSYPDTMLVIAGILYGVLIAPVIIWYFIAKYVKYIFKMSKENN